MSSHLGLHYLLVIGGRKWEDAITSSACIPKWEDTIEYRNLSLLIMMIIWSSKIDLFKTLF